MSIQYWYLGSDLHGDWRLVRNWVVNELSTPRDESALILLGDVGANYYGDNRDKYFKQALNKLNIQIYCLRGNHEMRIKDTLNYKDYSYARSNEAQGWVYTEMEYPNIHYFSDFGGYYMFNNHATLIIPGAYSVDKDYRLRNGWNWFANEQLNERERTHLSLLAHDIDFDYILAHTCPYSWEPYINDLFLSGINQNQIDKTTEKFLDNILDDCSYKHFYFGHFHDDRDIPEVKATMLYKKFIPLGEYINETEKRQD